MTLFLIAEENIIMFDSFNHNNMDDSKIHFWREFISTEIAIYNSTVLLYSTNLTQFYFSSHVALSIDRMFYDLELHFSFLFFFLKKQIIYSMVFILYYYHNKRKC